MTSADAASLVVAGVALALSLAQWVHTRQMDRLKLLLGDKEAVGYEALRIWRHPRRPVSSDLVHTLILVALFERSDRARIQIYRALEELKPRHEKRLVQMRSDIADAADRYPQSADPASLRHRLDQLDLALPWIAGRRGPAVPAGPAGQEGPARREVLTGQGEAEVRAR